MNAKGKTIALWILSGLLGLAFVAGGVTKLLAMPPHPAHFAGWGFPGWFMYLTGAIELVSGILLFIPRVAAFGAALLVGTMIGAALTHLMHADAANVAPSLVMLVLSAVVFYARRDTWLKLVGRDRRVQPA
jgi:putative oxidoreductase